MPTVRFKVDGLAELGTALKELPGKVQRKVLRKAIKPAAAILEREVVTQAPRETGALASRVKVKVSYSTKRSRISATIGTTSRDFQGDGYYDAFVQFGHKVGSRRKYGISHKRGAKSSTDLRRKVEGNPFAARAFETKKDAALASFTNDLAAGIEAEAKKP